MALESRTQLAALRAQRHHPVHGQPHTDRRAVAKAENAHFATVMVKAESAASELLGALKEKHTPTGGQTAIALGLLGR